MNQDIIFDLLMKRCGWMDSVICVAGGAWRLRAYHDGGWLEGYKTEPVIYWGA